jgi:hypothetical protein
MSIWDNPDLKPPADEFVKLERQGDKISGYITDIRAHRFSDTDVAPQITYIDDQVGMEKIWTAGQLQAKRKLAELRPNVGDWFSAELTGIEKRAGGKTLKHIEIEVRSAAQAGPQPVSEVVPEVLDRMRRAHASSPVLNRAKTAAAPASNRGFEEQIPF